MIIKNGLVFDKVGSFVSGDVCIKDDRIESVSFNELSSNNDGANTNTAKPPISEGEQIIDATDMYVIPGLVDVHFHGCAGHDFCEGTKEALQIIADYELSCGVTSICPASMTFDEERLAKIFEAAAEFENKQGSRLVGINMEGPFISPNKIGAQNPKYIHLADVDMFNRLFDKSKGLVKLVDIAPEEEGAIDFIKAVSDKVHVSIAHTCADYETSIKAFDAGADHVTHLYNAMPPYLHRAPGVIGATADTEKVFAELIVDGIHSEGAVVRTTFKMMGDDRLVFISDSMEATGMPDGEYELGGQKVFVKGNLATLESGTIAGSATNLLNCLRTAVKEMNIPLEKAVKCATVNPAKSIGLFDLIGSIDPNKKADFVILNKNLDIMYVIKDGVVETCNTKNRGA